ncbi:musculin [Tachyglossus aculeatus]|uniref:musculin n=1 Tax=Tachyglossus aculeatus TaxID=9261 RepID=UPI0018F6E4C3|nr:musculin [Tachyglossus aculeatus]
MAEKGCVGSFKLFLPTPALKMIRFKLELSPCRLEINRKMRTFHHRRHFMPQYDTGGGGSPPTSRPPPSMSKEELPPMALRALNLGYPPRPGREEEEEEEELCALGTRSGAKRKRSRASPGGVGRKPPMPKPAPGEGKQSQRNAANARERARMRVLSKAFSRLKTSLPWVPADTKLSKLDTLRLAASYIAHLRQLLQDSPFDAGYVHPVNLTWPFVVSGRPEQDSKDVPASTRLCGTRA